MGQIERKGSIDCFSSLANLGIGDGATTTNGIGGVTPHLRKAMAPDFPSVDSNVRECPSSSFPSNPGIITSSRVSQFSFLRWEKIGHIHTQQNTSRIIFKNIYHGFKRKELAKLRQ